MLIWVTALHCEAKPVIDYYRLKKAIQHRGFDCYQNDGMQCIVSGIGKISMAAATAWAAALNRQAPAFWINLGTAGAGNASVGDLFWVDKITENQSKLRFYPTHIPGTGLPSRPCISLDQPSMEYHPEAIYDMEASAFFAIASRFSPTEHVHSLKVISDNQQQQIGYNKAVISELIQNQVVAINDFAEKLQGTSRPAL